MRRHLLPLSALALAAACASVPPPPPPIVVPYETKVASMLRLEDHRVLTDARATPPPPPPVVDARGRPVPAPPPPPPTDLLTLVRDDSPRVRRRAALAIGRVGLAEGIPALAATLSDPDAEVRAMAAFALGLIGGPDVVDALAGALEDPAAIVRGRAAQALGLVGPDHAAATAPAIGRMVAALIEGGALSTPPTLTDALSVEADAILRAVTALTHLKSFEGLALAVLDGEGRPRTSWWPVAFALARVEDDRAVPALRALLSAGDHTTVAYAVRGLGERKVTDAVEALLPLLRAEGVHPHVRVNAVRALAQIGDRRAVPALLALLTAPGDPDGLTLEVVAALGALRSRDAEEALIDRIASRWPPMRAAVLRALARLDAETFTTILSALDPDPDWRVRAALADATTSLSPEVAHATLMRLRKDADARVLPAVLRAMAATKMPGVADEVARLLGSDDAAVRAAAATVAGDLTLTAVQPPLEAALAQTGSGRAQADTRWTVLSALAKVDAEAAVPRMRAALDDADWSVRLRAARWLEARTPAEDLATVIRPAPTMRPLDYYNAPHLVAPTVSPVAYIDTAGGTIEVQLAVLDAPLTVDNFVTLARQGYFNGLPVHRVVPNFVVQDGDPRGDGTGDPGYTIRDELHDGTYTRGTVGMALAGPDTGGSQWFITHSPQPHLDGRYTIFGRVTDGMEVVDALRVGDTVIRVRIWDGVEMR